MSTDNSSVLHEVLDGDFRATFWGMTREGVKFSEASDLVSESPSHLTYRDRVLELDSIVGYHFIDNTLVEAGYAFLANYALEGLYVEQYGKLKEHLSGIYGMPILDEDINTCCHNADGQGDQDLESMMLLSEWLTDRSIIRMVLIGGTEKCEFGVLHKSRGHIKVIENTEKSVRLGMS